MTQLERSNFPVVPELRVIPRDVHGVSRKQMSPNALRVLYRLREAGFGEALRGADCK